jgi:hypothetical protein
MNSHTRPGMISSLISSPLQLGLWKKSFDPVAEFWSLEFLLIIFCRAMDGDVKWMVIHEGVYRKKTPSRMSRTSAGSKAVSSTLRNMFWLSCRVQNAQMQKMGIWSDGYRGNSSICDSKSRKSELFPKLFHTPHPHHPHSSRKQLPEMVKLNLNGE